eukprot:13035556-Alexandrium_andersonii.AAC.1
MLHEAGGRINNIYREAAGSCTGLRRLVRNGNGLRATAGLWRSVVAKNCKERGGAGSNGEGHEKRQ